MFWRFTGKAKACPTWGLTAVFAEWYPKPSLEVGLWIVRLENGTPGYGT
jgi:hypothetical protein